MARYAKRGRPPMLRPAKDFGTPELQAKRKLGVTAEPLDSCLKQGTITDEEHRAGLHLRWLYTLKFGAPTVKSVEFDRVAGAQTHSEHDDAWRERRALEYKNAIEGLMQIHAKKVVMDVCIFHRTPEFLKTRGRRGYAEYEQFRDGMAWLVKHWRRK